MKKILILILFLLISFFSIFFALINLRNSNIYNGISINNIDISGKSKEEAFSILNDIKNKKTENPINLNYEDYNNTLYYSTIDISYDINSAVDEAYLLGKQGNIIQNNYTILKLLLFKKNIDIPITFNEELLDKSISDISSSLPNKIVEPNYSIEDKNLVIKNGYAGISVNTEDFKNNLLTIINDFSLDSDKIIIPVKYLEPEKIDIEKIHSEIHKEVKDAYYEKSPFKVYPEVIGIDFDIQNAQNQINEKPDKSEYVIKLNYTYPKTTVENLDINIFPDLLGSFSTRYDATNTSRSTNLQLATDKINGQIVGAGKEFSYNNIVGNRTISAGYKEAKVFSNGEVVDGIGGGVCQISSTLYNAAIFANLDITERYNHQFLTSYVSAGRDATVSYGFKDLKFKNNRTYPIKIVASVNSGVVKIDIYGIKEDNEYEISIDVETISNINYNIKYEKTSELPLGEEKIKQSGARGIVVNVYKVKKKNGTIISKDIISKDTYNALDRVVLQGTATE